MVTIFKVTIIIQKNMEKDCIFGPVTKQNIKDNLRKIHFKVKLKSILLINNTISEELKMVKEMDKEHINMKMAIGLLENGKMI